MLTAVHAKIESEEPHACSSGFSIQYMSQYISLMLIILTFVIGSFSIEKNSKVAEIKQQAVAAEAQKKAEKQPKIAPPAEIGILKYADLFPPNETLPNEDKAGALVEFLRSHDIAVDLKIFNEPGNNHALSLARSMTLSKYLMRQDVPSDAYTVTVIDRISDNQLEADFFGEAR